MVTMIFIKLLNVLNFFFALAFSAGLFSVLRPIQHSYRLTKLQSVTSNKSIGNSYAEYVQYYDKQFINLNCTTYLKVIPYRGYIELIKCKEYYMDCKIHKVMEITNICDKVEYGLSLIQIGYRNREIKCPFQGDYIIRNITYDPTTALPLFFGPTEKWWEYTFKLNVTFFDFNEIELLKYHIQAYILTYRLKH